MTTTGIKKQNSDKGFSLVELIIVVSILAIAAIPLMRSMAMATRVNAKAQSMQNATSLAESIMEEVKSTPIDTLKSTYGTDFSGGVMTITKSDVTATQGEKFNATITIDTNEYSGITGTPIPTSSPNYRNTNVGSANTVLLPQIEDIDSLSQAVLTSVKEFNRYDEEALSYFNQKLEKYPDETATIKEKIINITKGDVESLDGSTPDGVTVKASVTYKDNLDNTYYRDLYMGTFVQQSGESIDSNIYIFYKKEGITISKQVVMNITDNSSYTNSDPAKKSESHRIYFIRQDSDTTGPVVNITRGSESYTFKYTNTAGSYKTWKEDHDTDVELITNIVEGHSGSSGYIYHDVARNRVYKITVELKKGSEVYATLTSTSTASDEL